MERAVHHLVGQVAFDPLLEKVVPLEELAVAPLLQTLQEIFEEVLVVHVQPGLLDQVLLRLAQEQLTQLLLLVREEQREAAQLIPQQKQGGHIVAGQETLDVLQPQQLVRYLPFDLLLLLLLLQASFH